jgi:hypothetical protein
MICTLFKSPEELIKFHRSLHCLQERPTKNPAIKGQFDVPYSWTKRLMDASSYNISYDNLINKSFINASTTNHTSDVHARSKKADELANLIHLFRHSILFLRGKDEVEKSQYFPPCCNIDDIRISSYIYF